MYKAYTMIYIIYIYYTLHCVSLITLDTHQISMSRPPSFVPRTTRSPSMEGPTWPSVKTRHRSSQPRFDQRNPAVGIQPRKYGILIFK